MIADAFADAARGLIGTRFALHGRDPATGLDCVGLLAASLRAIGRTPRLPDTYSLRTRPPADADRIAAGCDLQPAQPPLRRGDVVLARIGSCQCHLLIALDRDCFVHAHAGLGRVALHAASLASPAIGVWRLADSN